MPPKKAAKKQVGPHDEKQHHSKDLRRAYEHLGRVQTLQRQLKDGGDDVSVLVGLAQEQSAEGRAKDVADLLRAAEHLGFAELADSKEVVARLSGSVEAALRAQLDHLLKKAEEHWEPKDAHPAIASIYRDTRHRAEQARKGRSYRMALELMRCAEALAHLHLRAPGKVKKITTPHKLRELAAS